MLTKLNQKFFIEPILEQVKSLGPFKRLQLNDQSGEFFGDPWVTKSEFKNTPIGEVLESLGNIGQARLLVLNSAESYTAHADPDDRIHLAIETNPYSFLVDIESNVMYHLPADGELWHMDTGKIHVATNWGGKDRIHLNIRVLMPKFNPDEPSMRMCIVQGDVDWKQVAYMPIMRLVNIYSKTNDVYGFKGVSEREVLINTKKPELFDEAIELIRQSGVELEVTLSR